MRSCRASAVVVSCAILALTASCDRAPRQSTSPPGTSAATRPAESQEFLAQLAALRHLVGEQPLAADRSYFAAYLIKGDSAPALADALSETLRDAAPPVVSSLDVYRRKGRTMDRATGKPVKVFQVRLVEFRPGQAPEAQVLASWDAGRLAGGASHYRLTKGGDRWVVVEKAQASAPASE